MSAPSPEPARIRFVDVDGVRLRTSVRGSGPPLLLITGLGASLDLAEPFERELVKRGRQVVSFDAPGVGESTPYLVPRRMRGAARTVAEMAAALGYHRMDVLGVSLGGVVAQQLARQSPDLVRRLILAATGPGLGGVPGSPAGPARAGHPAPLPPAGLLPSDRGADIRRPGPHRPRRAAGRLDRSLPRAAQPAWLHRPALRDHGLDQRALAAQAPAAHARSQRRRRPDRSAGQRPHPRQAHPQRAATRRARRRTPVPARTPGRDRPTWLPSFSPTDDEPEPSAGMYYRPGGPAACVPPVGKTTCWPRQTLPPRLTVRSAVAVTARTDRQSRQLTEATIAAGTGGDVDLVPTRVVAAGVVDRPGSVDLHAADGPGRAEVDLDELGAGRRRAGGLPGVRPAVDRLGGRPEAGRGRGRGLSRCGSGSCRRSGFPARSRAGRHRGPDRP